MDYEIIVDDQYLGDLIYVTSVDRTMGPSVPGRVIKINAYIIDDVLDTIDVLNKIFTGESQRFVFTDQPDRYWEGFIKEDIQPSNSEQWSQITFEIEVPSGVALAVEETVITVPRAQTVLVENKGTETVYPEMSFKMNSETQLVAITGYDGVYQYGTPVEFENVQITSTETTEEIIPAHYKSVSKTLINEPFNTVSWPSYTAINDHNANWSHSGSYSQGTGTTVFATPKNGRLTIKKSATHWATGERMSSWVKGRTFVTDGTRNQTKSKSKKAYRIKNNGVYLGWVLEEDLAGAITSNAKGTISPSSFGSGEMWHGPAITKTFKGDPTDWQATLKCQFHKTNSNQMGALYLGVFAGDDEIAGAHFSAHDNGMYNYPFFSVHGKGLTQDRAKRTWFKSFNGVIRIRKSGSKVRFEVINENNKKQLIKEYSFKEVKDMKATRVVIWSAQLGNKPKIGSLSLNNAHFYAYNAQEWVPEGTETSTETRVNTVSQRVKAETLDSDDTLVIDMQTAKAMVNELPSLNPIAYGSKRIGIPPGIEELIISSSDTPPDLTVRFREVFR